MDFEQKLKLYIKLKKNYKTDSTFNGDETLKKAYEILHKGFLNLYCEVRLRTGIDPGDEFNFERWFDKEFMSFIYFEDLLKENEK